MNQGWIIYVWYGFRVVRARDIKIDLKENEEMEKIYLESKLYTHTHTRTAHDSRLVKRDTTVGVLCCICV